MRHSLWKRFVLFIRFDIANIISFIVELAILYLLLSSSIEYYFAVPIAFVLATTVHWVLCHWWVFDASRRSKPAEYLNFISIYVLNLIIAVVLVSFCVQILSLHPILARILSGLVIALLAFYLNARFNFRSRYFTHQ